MILFIQKLNFFLILFIVILPARDRALATTLKIAKSTKFIKHLSFLDKFLELIVIFLLIRLTLILYCFEQNQILMFFK